MSEFLQFHLLTSYPPSNLNRDDLGRPKQAMMGGANRLRISSQSLKRAWRQSDVFEDALAANKGTRTREVGVIAYKKLKEKGVDDKLAVEVAKQIGSQTGKLRKASKDDPMEELRTEQLAHLSPDEWEVLDGIVDSVVQEKKKPDAEKLLVLRETQSAADIALFGRMLASSPKYNIEAAAQVAHAITVHKVAVEDDFFTAVDDLNEGGENLGAGHMGETEFAAGVYYIYVCINKDLLLENLDGKEKLASDTVSALIEAAATVAPGGKQNSFGSRARASFILAEKGSQQPRSLSVAFLKPVGGTDMVESAVKSLLGYRDKIDKAYGKCYDACSKMHVSSGEGTLKEIISFATE